MLFMGRDTNGVRFSIEPNIEINLISPALLTVSLGESGSFWNEATACDV
jgi:hypothetical protein